MRGALLFGAALVGPLLGCESPEPSREPTQAVGVHAEVAPVPSPEPMQAVGVHAAGEPGSAAREPGPAAGEPGAAAREPGSAPLHPGPAAHDRSALLEPAIPTPRPPPEAAKHRSGCLWTHVRHGNGTVTAGAASMTAVYLTLWRATPVITGRPMVSRRPAAIRPGDLEHHLGEIFTTMVEGDLVRVWAPAEVGGALVPEADHHASVIDIEVLKVK